MALLAFIFGLQSTDCRIAYAEGEVKKDLENEINDKLNDLSTDELNEFFDSLDIELKTSLGGSVSELIKGILRGEINMGSDKIVEYLVKATGKHILSMAVSLGGIAVLAILYGMSGQITSGFKSNGTKQLVYWAVYGGIAVTIGITVNNLILELKSVINTISAVIEVGAPIFSTVITAVGGVGAVSFLEPSITLVCGVAVKIIVTFVLPLFYAVTVFTIVGNMSDNIKLDKLSKALKAVGSWTLGIVFSLITTLISVQGLVGAGIDTVSVKSAKFALSSYVPILGGYLSDGFDIVMASAVLIKNAVGLALFLIMLGVMLVPLIKTVCYSLALKLLAGFLEPITDKKVMDLLYSTAQNLSLPVASCAGLGFIVFVVLMIVIGAFNVGVV